jgi:hypothetical protein
MTVDNPQGIYTKLENLLKNKDFREADQETRRVMLAVARKDGWFTREDAQNFPCEDLRLIDQLWLQHSGGKFSISVQQQICRTILRQESWERTYGDWRDIASKLGWYAMGWLSYEQLDVCCYMNRELLHEAPKGHLPTVALAFGDLEMLLEFRFV